MCDSTPEGDPGAAMEEMLRQGRARPRQARRLPARRNRPARPMRPARPARRRRQGPFPIAGFSASGCSLSIRGRTPKPRGSTANRYERDAVSSTGSRSKLRSGSRGISARGRASPHFERGNEGSRIGTRVFRLPMGSAFAEIEAARFRLRVGYYSLALTPLTCVRWDWGR